ncbi:MAG: hypothetical protein HOB82_01320 [Alphaproteobacteria bacterium]|nr:hypothetical protein [Alphaproteobacteria bacterium]
MSREIPQSPRISGEKVALGDIEVVYADSRSGLEAAWAMGLSRDAEIRTSSPNLLLDPDLGAVASDKEFHPARLKQIFEETTEWAKSFYLELLEETGSSQLALLAAHRASRFQTPIFKIMALQESDFHRPVAVLSYDISDSFKQALLTPAVLGILKVSSKFREIQLPESALDFPTPVVAHSAPFLERLHMSTWASRGYRGALWLWNRIPFRSSKGTILILDENSLLKETAFEFAKRGYGLRRLGVPQLEPGHTLTDKAAEFLGRLPPKISKQFEKWLLPEAIGPATDHLMTEIADYVSRYDSTLDGWRKTFASLDGDRPRAIFANRVYPAEAISLHQVASEYGLPVASFQHGVSREIGLVGDRDEIWFETTSANIFFTHTEEAARITNSSELGSGRAIAAGIEQDFRRAGTLPPDDSSAPPIWYIGTMGHIGNFTMLNRGMRDLDQSKFEIKMIDKVLGQLPHRVLYKPYPGCRYDGPDPVVDRASTAKQIHAFTESRDLRYMLRNSRVLITSRTSSTVSLCLMSNRPLVYVLFPGRPLSPSAREAMDKGVFLFDSEADNFWDELRDFLSQPIEKIEAKWLDRAAARADLIHEFFDAGNGHAAARAADMLEQSNFNPSRMA